MVAAAARPSTPSRANAVDAAVVRAARPAKRKKQPYPYEIVHALLTFFARWS